MNNYIVADSLTDTIQFDVVDTFQFQQVQSNGNPVKPVTEMILMPLGIGFAQSLDLVTGEVIDYVINQTVTKKPIKLTLAWKGSTAYRKYQDFAAWVAQYFDLNKYHIRFSYLIGEVRRYVEVAVIDLELLGRDGRYVSAQLTMKPLTSFYEEYDGSFTIVTDSNTGKIYAYQYPYIYGGGAFSGNNSINNQYLKKIPLKIVLKGPMGTPYVSISRINEDNEVEENPYLTVQFQTGFSIAEDEEVVIDAFNNRVYKNTYELNSAGDRIRLISTTDVFNYVDKTYDTFLFAEPGKSRIAASVSTQGSECRVSYMRYVL